MNRDEPRFIKKNGKRLVLYKFAFCFYIFDKRLCFNKYIQYTLSEVRNNEIKNSGFRKGQKQHQHIYKYSLGPLSPLPPQPPQRDECVCVYLYSLGSTRIRKTVYANREYKYISQYASTKVQICMHIELYLYSYLYIYMQTDYGSCCVQTAGNRPRRRSVLGTSGGL